MSTLHTEVADGIARVTIEVPPLQLLDAHLIADLWQLLDRLDAEPDVRVAVFRSADPDFFVMHADVEMLLAMDDQSDPPTTPNFAVVAFERLRRLPCATIGVLDGIARGGGCELLSAMDVRVGSTRALVGQPEVALGILPGAGGTVRWARTLGRARALELLLTGRDLGAEEALAVGWLQSVVAPDGLDAEADRLARRIARMPATSIAAIKDVVDRSLGPIDDALLAESQALVQLMSSGARELMQRFLAEGGQTRDAEAGDFQGLIAGLGSSPPPRG